ncbi:MAG: 1-acyl-sn-glycerol-3-phosphate acyltransferase [Clostridia bacterium]|nr:1-acyl-sn-glycerol-3-phosphate acyltransferase [Clostridia bacterium]
MNRYDRLVRFFRPLIRFLFPIRVTGLPESLPEEGIIVCPNHISFFDPLFLAIVLPRNITFMAKEELFSRPVIGKWLKECEVIPLSRDGGDAAKLRQAVRELKSGKLFSLFPQGTRCRYPLKEEDFKAGVGMMSALSGAKIIPVGIYAKNYKVRPFRRTYIHFGELESFLPEEKMGVKDSALWITSRLFERITALEEKAREEAAR